MKVTPRGEWIRHKWKVRKGYPLHIAVDIETKKFYLRLPMNEVEMGVDLENY